MITKKRTLLMLLCILLWSATDTVSAFGISGVSFGRVEPGTINNITVLVYSSEKDFDNHFVMEKGGEIADLLSFSPTEFDLPAGGTEKVVVTLNVPADAQLDDNSGWIKAVGKRPVPGAGGEGSVVGYTISLKKEMHANFVNPSVISSTHITSFSSPSTKVSSGDILMFDLDISNDGNMLTTVYPNVTVFKEQGKVEEIRGLPEELTVGGEKHIKLLWDTSDAEEEKYTAIASVKNGDTILTSDPIEITIGNSSPTMPSLSALLALSIILMVATHLLIRKKKKGGSV
jgi:hypothetical protein